MTTKTSAVLVGLAVGDALGMPFEQPRDKIHPGLAAWDGSMVPGAWHKLPAGHWTDDTEMAVCLAESLVACRDYNPRDAAARYLAWSEGTPHGMGSTTRTAMAKLKAGVPWHSSGTAITEVIKVGSGTAMRIAPMGVWTIRAHNDRRIALLQAEISRDARITHAHTEAEAAALVIAATVLYMMTYNPTDAKELYNMNRTVLAEYYPHSELYLFGLSRCHACLTLPDSVAMAKLGRQGNACSIVSSALWCVMKHMDSYQNAVIAAVRGGGDTDTRAAIVGAIMGAKVGLEGIPKVYLDVLLHAEYLKALDVLLYEDAIKELKLSVTPLES